MFKLIIRYICVVVLAFLVGSLIILASLMVGGLIKGGFIDKTICIFDMFNISIIILLVCVSFPAWFLYVCSLVNHIESTIGIVVSDSVLQVRCSKSLDIIAICNYPVSLLLVYINAFLWRFVFAEVVLVFCSRLFCIIHMTIVLLVSAMVILFRMRFFRDGENTKSLILPKYDGCMPSRESIRKGWNHSKTIAILTLICTLIVMIRGVFK